MAFKSKPTKLCFFRWNLSELPSEVSAIAKPFLIRAADKSDLNTALRVIRSSYELDPDWSGCAHHIEEVVLPHVKKVFGDDTFCLFVQHGNRVIAASAYVVCPEDKGVHLVSGPCVLSEYRNRGIGAALLGATLETLRQHGTKEALGFARPNTVSSKFLYTKFGGKLEASQPLHEATAAA